MNLDPPISMYVPARNAERTLADCIASIRAQSRMPDELFILADPRSTDRTMEIAHQTGVAVIKQKGNTLGAARNEAVLHARHPWLAGCDSDVVLEPAWLEKLASRRDQRVAGIQGCTGERVRTPADAWRALHMPHHWGDYPIRNPFMLISEALFDRHALLAVGGYRNDLNYYEDSDLCQRLRDAGYDLFYEPTAVATYLRTDDTLSLLNLRWKYAEYRQNQNMDRYAGLLRKIEINREYALTTLARSLARDRQELVYISFLLFFHHLILDLRSLHARRPLLSAEVRREYELALAGSVFNVLAEHHHGLDEWVRHDLTALMDDASPQPSSRTPTCHGQRLQTSRISGERSIPGWHGHIDAVCREFDTALFDVLEGSAAYIHGKSPADSVARWNRPPHDELQQSLDNLPPTVVINEHFVDDVYHQWPDAGPIVSLTPCSADEKKILTTTARPGTSPVALAAHLECLADPRSVFSPSSMPANGHPHPDRLIVCYQPPTRFIPGADILTAADLASLASAHGWSIRKFDTLVGRTRLMMEMP